MNVVDMLGADLELAIIRYRGFSEWFTNAEGMLVRYLALADPDEQVILHRLFAEHAVGRAVDSSQPFATCQSLFERSQALGYDDITREMSMALMFARASLRNGDGLLLAIDRVDSVVQRLEGGEVLPHGYSKDEIMDDARKMLNALRACVSDSGLKRA